MGLVNLGSSIGSGDRQSSVISEGSGQSESDLGFHSGV